MIQFIIVVVGLIILGIIFIRRYMSVEKGISSFFGRKQTGAKLLLFHRTPDSFEVTVDEMIPDRSTVDLKKIAKADLMMKKAEASFSKGDYKQGERFLIQTLSLDPSNVNAYHKLGLLYLRQEQFGRAETMYQKLVMSAKNDPVYFSNLAVALYQQKKLDAAKVNYKKAIEMDGSRAGRFFSLAQVLKELGEIQDSLNNFKKAIEMDPKNLDYLLTLAQVYMDANFMDEARQLLGQILVLYPHNEIAKEMMHKVTRLAGATGPKESLHGEDAMKKSEAKTANPPE